LNKIEKLQIARDAAYAAYDELLEGYRLANKATKAAAVVRRNNQELLIKLEEAYFAAADAADEAFAVKNAETA
jgi:hypothetical protein